MLPYIPPSLMVELTHEHLERRLRTVRRQYRYDPDQFEDAPSVLQPDPVFMWLRHMVANGPIGRLVRWFERRAEAREDRASTQRAGAGVKWTERARIDPLPAPSGDAPDEERTAA